MSTKYEKLLAKHELQRRQFKKVARDEERINSLDDEELQKILDEPDEDES